MVTYRLLRYSFKKIETFREASRAEDVKIYCTSRHFFFTNRFYVLKNICYFYTRSYILQALREYNVLYFIDRIQYL